MLTRKRRSPNYKRRTTPLTLTQHHPRRFREMKYVYPVVSRRSGGLSVGVNLSPTGLCNFACAYCQILGETGNKQQNGHHSDHVVDFLRMESELRDVIAMVQSGELFQDTIFSRTPTHKRVLRDIAFSGNGEPTLSPQFPEAVRQVAAIRTGHCPESTKLVVITNGTCLAVPAVSDALQVLHANNGEVWAKLDAGTEEHFRTVSRSTIAFEKILSNLVSTAKTFPLVIQSCFLSIHGTEPPSVEIQAYITRLREIIDGGGAIRRVQLYTAARKTPEPWANPLPDDQIDVIAARVRRETDLVVETFYSR